MLAALIGLNPITMDAYLPALATIASDFGASLQRIEHSIGMFMYGYAAGLLLAAPASDRLGRRPTALFGLAFYLFATVLALFSQSATMFNMARVLQGLGAGAALVNAGAVVRDLYDEHDSARQLSRIMILLLILPLVAPALGAAVLLVGNWQWIFAGFLVYATGLMIWIAAKLPETAPPQEDQVRSQPVLPYLVGHLQSVLAHRRATAFALTAAASSSTLFLFLSDAAFIYLDYFGLTAQQFPVYFGANVVLMALAHFANIRLLMRFRPRQIIPVGIVALWLNAALFVVMTAISPPTLLVCGLFMMVSLAVQSFIVNNAVAAYMSRFKTNAGMANAISGSLIFFVGATAGVLLGELHNGTPLSLALSFLASATLAAFAARLALTERS